MDTSIRPRVLVTGATGFVGTHLVPALHRVGADVVGGTRDVAEAAAARPSEAFVEFDLARPGTVRTALEGCTSAVYLVHGMGGGADDTYERTERAAALTFREAAAAAGVRRIVYLGGMPPAGEPSRHLRSRLTTGCLLREGQVPTIELQASMIIGSGSESFRMVRDLAARLPAMLLPAWLDTRTQPIGIADVVYAILRSVYMDDPGHVAWPLPGPETLTARTILERTAALMGRQPWTTEVPLVTPRLSAYWIRLVTRTDPQLARELVEGLLSDIVAPDDGAWALWPQHRRQSFDEATRLALAGEAEELSAAAALVEDVAGWMTPTATEPVASA